VIDGELLRKIDPEELSNGAWMKKNKVSKHDKLPYKNYEATTND
jgi:hypothetical protein